MSGLRTLVRTTRRLGFFRTVRRSSVTVTRASADRRKRTVTLRPFNDALRRCTRGRVGWVVTGRAGRVSDVALPAPSTAWTSTEPSAAGTANVPSAPTATAAPLIVTSPIPDVSVALHVAPETASAGGVVSVGASSFAKTSGWLLSVRRDQLRDLAHVAVDERDEPAVAGDRAPLGGDVADGGAVRPNARPAGEPRRRVADVDVVGGVGVGPGEVGAERRERDAGAVGRDRGPHPAASRARRAAVHGRREGARGRGRGHVAAVDVVAAEDVVRRVVREAGLEDDVAPVARDVGEARAGRRGRVAGARGCPGGQVPDDDVVDVGRRRIPGQEVVGPGRRLEGHDVAVGADRRPLGRAVGLDAGRALGGQDGRAGGDVAHDDVRGVVAVARRRGWLRRRCRRRRRRPS